MKILLARQPIFDTTHNIVGFEVLCADGEQGMSMDEVLVDALLGAGLDEIRQGRPAYLPVSTGLLMRAGGLLQPERAALLVRADDPENGLAACRELRHAGFRLVLDCYAGGAVEAAYLDVVNVVKIDIRAFAPHELAAHASALRHRGLELLADGVEHDTEYGICRNLGFTLFEGYHFSRPEVVERRDLSIQHMRTFRIMRMVRNLAISEHAIEKEFQGDAALAYKLLRIVNSATIGAVGVRSIGHAIRLLGRDNLYRWLALLLISRCGDQALETEIMRAALLRARFCELLAERAGRELSPGSAYLVGLLSALEPYLALSARDTARELELAAEPAEALINGAGPLGALLTLAIGYEHGDFVDVLERAEHLGLESTQLVSCYLDAIAFVSQNAVEVSA